MIKLAICIPVYGDCKSKFTMSLASAIAYFYEADIQDADGNQVPRMAETFMVSCSMLVEGRTRLVAEALAWGATHMLWMDADHVFPRDAIPVLLAHDKEIVGCNYSRRLWPTAPTAYKDGLVYTTLEKAKDRVVEEVEHLGFGLCLMNMSVFDKLQLWADEHANGNFLPLFKFEEKPDLTGFIGEDVYFFRKCRAAGVTVWCDHALSWDVGHMFDHILTNAHAIAHEEKYKAFMSEQHGKNVRKAVAALEGEEK